MRILWIVNMVLPELAEYLNIQTGSSGTWMIDISQRLSKESNIKLAIACVYGDEYKEIAINNITYYILPGDGKNMLFYTKKYAKLWGKVYNSFHPDIVHLHGTEYSHGLSFLRRYPKIKSMVSIQGVLNRIKDVDFAGLSYYELIRYRTLNEYIKMNGMIERHLLNIKNAKYETEIIKRSSYANTVNCWDESIVKSINPKIRCFNLEYNLRDEFYTAPKWDFSKCVPFTIFTNPGGTPLKGLHQLIKAIAIVKLKYDNVQLVVPGMGDKTGNMLHNCGYAKYISNLIKELKLTNNITFKGLQNAMEMIENISKSNIVVIPSAIEGTSLVLREAMYIGGPSIASFRGGMADFINDKYDGFLYDYPEYPYLATRIIELFENRELCIKFSERAIEKAERAHDREKNINAYVETYNQIIK